jgi:predicted nucleic acid-binding protein
MIVLLDTNVLISALVFGSPSSTPVLALARATDQDQIATCAELQFELFRILSTNSRGLPQ